MVRIYLEPTSTDIVNRRFDVEKELGVNAKDSRELKEIARKYPESGLRELNKKFGIHHGLSMLTNLVAFVIGCYHLYLIAISISF